MKKVDVKISKAKAPRGFEQRLANAFRNGTIGARGSFKIYVKHGDHCRIFRGRRCNCAADIHCAEKDSVTEIDAKGHGEPRRKCLRACTHKRTAKC